MTGSSGRRESADPTAPTRHRSPFTGHATRPAEPSKHPRDRLKRELSFVDATMLVVSSVIGVGIFLTPGRIADILPSPGLILSAWATGIC